MGDNLGYSLEGNGTDLSKLYPSGGTNMGFSAVTTTYMPNINYMQVIPNSHYWGNLDQLLTYLGYIQSSGNQWYTAWGAEVENIIIGLENTIKNGYRIKMFDNSKLDFSEKAYPVFMSVENMLSFVKDADFSGDYQPNQFLKDFIISIENTIQSGYNLTNGLKMERKDVYKRIDGERDYQDRTWVARRTLDGTPDEEKPVAEWINYIEYHLSKAKDKVYHLDTQAALEEIRKVTALGVRTMEIHGCPPRQSEVDNGGPQTQCCDGDCDCKK